MDLGHQGLQLILLAIAHVHLIVFHKSVIRMLFPSKHISDVSVSLVTVSMQKLLEIYLSTLWYQHDIFLSACDCDAVVMYMCVGHWQ